jgi:hypothetical protein
LNRDLARHQKVCHKTGYISSAKPYLYKFDAH